MVGRLKLIAPEEDLKRIGKELKGAPQELRRELFRGINRATKPARQQALAELVDVLPDSGGASTVIRKNTKLNTRRNMRGRNVGVRITAKSPRTVQLMNRGILRHPVFGNRSIWVNQDIKPGWFTRPMENSADDVRSEIMSAVERVTNQIANS